MTLAVDETGSLKVEFSHKPPAMNRDPDECSGHCPFDVAKLHREYFAMDINPLAKFVEQLKVSVGQKWRYCTMGIQQVALRDPVFTKSGDFVCELDLIRGES